MKPQIYKIYKPNVSMLWDIVEGFVYFSLQDQRLSTQLSNNVQVKGLIFSKLVGTIRVSDQQRTTHHA